MQVLFEHFPHRRAFWNPRGQKRRENQDDKQKQHAVMSAASSQMWSMNISCGYNLLPTWSLSERGDDLGSLISTPASTWENTTASSDATQPEVARVRDFRSFFGGGGSCLSPRPCTRSSSPLEMSTCPGWPLSHESGVRGLPSGCGPRKWRWSQRPVEGSRRLVSGPWSRQSQLQ